MADLLTLMSKVNAEDWDTLQPGEAELHEWLRLATVFHQQKLHMLVARVQIIVVDKGQMLTAREFLKKIES